MRRHLGVRAPGRLPARNAQRFVYLRHLFETTRIGQRERSVDHCDITRAPDARYAPAAAVRLHAALEYDSCFLPGPRSGGSQHHARETPQGERRCLGRPARRTERDDHWFAAPAGERQPMGQPLADHDAPSAHQLADGHDRIREVAV